MEEILSKVKTAFEAAFKVDPQTITIDTTPSHLEAWDSMGHISLASSLERAFALSFNVDDLMAMESVRDICRVVKCKLISA